jgi:CheY-like chemotaxis protein
MRAPRILIVDDDVEWRRGALSHPLQGLQYEITSIDSREKAFDTLAEEEFDLVILNVRLSFDVPDTKIVSQWAELLDVIRQKDTEALVITSRSFPAIIQLDTLVRIAFKDYRVIDFMMKEDFSPKEYRETVRKTIQQRFMLPESQPVRHAMPQASKAPADAPKQPRTSAYKPSEFIEEATVLTFEDRKRLSAELNRLPDWEWGQVNDRRGILMAAGLRRDLVLRYPLAGTGPSASGIVIDSLQELGHLLDRPGYLALGALADYLLENTPHVQGKAFLAILISAYRLITDTGYQATLEAKYPVVQRPPSDGTFDLEWQTEQPPFDAQWTEDPEVLEAIHSSRAAFLPAVFLEKGEKMARAVCRVEKSINRALGTGFLIAPNLVLTCHHVVPTDAGALGARVRFGYRLDQDGKLVEGETFGIKKILARSPADELDYAVLQLDAMRAHGSSSNLPKLTSKPLQKDGPLFIIGHPHGRPQQLVLQDNWITYVAADHRRVQYMTNTLHGSSGSPACDDNWDVVALHHSGKPYPDPLLSKPFQGNEGIPMAAILPEIQHLLSSG